MEENQKLQKAELIQRINTLKQQNDRFISWYVATILKEGKIYGSKWDPYSSVYLPYSGDDYDTILLLFKKFLNLQYPKYTIDEDNIKPINYLIDICLKKAEKPGLIIWGNVGAGKTALLLLWLEFRTKILAYKKYSTVDLERGKNEPLLNILHYTPSRLMSEFSNLGHSFFEKSSGVSSGRTESGQIMFLDDIGLATTVNHYGSHVNIIENIIYSRYDVFKQNPEFEFYGTTNLTADELKPILELRAFSRILEMAEWNTGLLLGEDRRKDEQRLMRWPSLHQSNMIASGSYPKI